MERTFIQAEINNRTLLIDVAKHFPAAREYDVERLAESLAHTRDVQPNSVGIWTLNV
jgi:hypothetical protein